MEKAHIELKIYGILIKIDSCAETINRLEKDFSFFLDEEHKGPSKTVRKIEITANLEKPPIQFLHKDSFSIKKSDLRWWDIKNKRFIDYNTKALSVYDYESDQCYIYSEDIDLLHELVYLAVHSRVGEVLDKRGLHRVHAMGVSYNGRGALCLLPRGGGKTTLCLELLKSGKVKLLSDDTPVINGSAQVLPFPVRIGVEQNVEVEIPEEYIGSIVRRKYGIKKLIDIRYFKGRVSGKVPAAVLLIGKRTSGVPKIVKISKLYAVIPMLKNCIIGIGIPQMTEYFIRFNIKDIIAKSFILFSRILVSLNLILKSRVCMFYLGREKGENSSVLLGYLDRINQSGQD